MIRLHLSPEICWVELNGDEIHQDEGGGATKLPKAVNKQQSGVVLLNILLTQIHDKKLTVILIFLRTLSMGLTLVWLSSNFCPIRTRQTM